MADPTSPAEKGPGTLLLATIGVALSASVMMGATFGLFADALQKTFGWTKPQVMAGILVHMLTVVLAAPLVGGMMDRYGARLIILPAIVAYAVLFASLATIDGGLLRFYLTVFVLGLVAPGCSFVAYTRFVAGTRPTRPGAALGIVLAGTGLGGTILPVLAQAIIGVSGWRTAYLVLAGIVVGVALPVTALFLRNRERHIVRRAQLSGGVPFRDILKSALFWRMVVSFAVLGLAGTGVVLNLVSVGRSLGFSPGEAALLQSASGMAMIVGRVGGGILLDRWHLRLVGAVGVLAMIAGVVMLAGAPTMLPLALAAAACVGVGAGIETDLASYGVWRYFGIAAFGRIGSILLSVTIAGSAFGPVLFALVEQASGGPSGALWTMAAVMVAGVFMILGFKPYPVVMADPPTGVA